MFALKACAAKREEGVLGRTEFFAVAIVGGKRGGVLFVKGQEPMVVEENLADRLIELARKIAAEKAGK